MTSTIAVTDRGFPINGSSVALTLAISSISGALPWLTPPNPRIGAPAGLQHQQTRRQAAFSGFPKAVFGLYFLGFVAVQIPQRDKRPPPTANALGRIKLEKQQKTEQAPRERLVYTSKYHIKKTPRVRGKRPGAILFREFRMNAPAGGI